MADQLSQAVQDYLKASHAAGGADDPVSPADVAERLGVRKPSVTGMLKRLAKAGWIEYRPGTKARLTPAGIAEANMLLSRTYRKGFVMPEKV